MAFLEHRLDVRVTQKTVLNPGLVQMVNLLVLNKAELVDMIAEELAENPVLEEAAEVMEADLPADGDGATLVQPDGADLQYERLKQRDENPEPSPDSPEPDRALDNDGLRDFDLQEFESYLNDGSSRPREVEVFERPSFETFLSQPTTLTDHLEWQLGLVQIGEGVRQAAESIIGNLNVDGYLAAVDEKGRETSLSLGEIAATGGHTLEEVERALLVVQGFDPAGVAARDVRECLLIQLARFDADHPVAMEIVTDHLRLIQNQRFKDVARSIGRPLEAVLEAVEVIRSLDPRPGQRYNQPEAQHIEPDVFFVKVGAEHRVVANEDEVPQLRLSQTYRRMLETKSVDREARNYVKDRFRSALQLLKNIEQRKNIITKVCEVILRRQADFFDHGIDYLRPMMIKDVAEEVGVNPSTVSRAVANKYAYTPQGVYELRFFFSEGVRGSNGGNTSLTLVKEKVRRLIEAEDSRKPLTDQKIAELLKQEGISVTRRSITKYREDLKIPSTHQRRVKI